LEGILHMKQPSNSLHVCYNATLQYNKHFKTLILFNIII